MVFAVGREENTHFVGHPIQNLGKDYSTGEAGVETGKLVGKDQQQPGKYKL